MNLDYESRSLRVENAEGLRWQLTDADKPRLSFAYDALHVGADGALRRVGSDVQALAASELAEVQAYLQTLTPPPWATFQNQIATDLRALVHGLINSVTGQLEYDGLLDVMITARPDSTDLYSAEARRVLHYVDSLWNAYYGLAANIRNTPSSELKTVKEYAEMMPFPPPIDYFSSGLHAGLFDATTDKR